MSTSMHFGMVDQTGQIKLKDHRWFREVTHGMAGKIICFTIREAHKASSGPQFRYYRGVVLPMFMAGLIEVGYEIFEVRLDDLHRILFSRYSNSLPIEIQNIEDMPANLFREYTERLQRIAANFLNIYIPDPSENK